MAKWSDYNLNQKITWPSLKCTKHFFQNLAWIERNWLRHLACQVFDEMLPMDLAFWQALQSELQSEISLKWFIFWPFTLKDTLKGVFKSFPKSYHLLPSDFPNSRCDWFKSCIKDLEKFSKIQITSRTS